MDDDSRADIPEGQVVLPDLAPSTSQGGAVGSHQLLEHRFPREPRRRIFHSSPFNYVEYSVKDERPPRRLSCSSPAARGARGAGAGAGAGNRGREKPKRGVGRGRVGKRVEVSPNVSSDSEYGGYWGMQVSSCSASSSTSSSTSSSSKSVSSGAGADEAQTKAGPEVEAEEGAVGLPATQAECADVQMLNLPRGRFSARKFGTGTIFQSLLAGEGSAPREPQGEASGLGSDGISAGASVREPSALPKDDRDAPPAQLENKVENEEVMAEEAAAFAEDVDSILKAYFEKYRL